MPEAERDARPELSRESTPELMNEVLSHASGLVKGEVDLLRAEVQENLNKAVAAIGLLVAAVVLVLVALNVLAAALVAWLAELGLGAGWSALIVGGALLVIGAILAASGKNKLKLASLAPTRTARNVRRDTEAVKEATAHGR